MSKAALRSERIKNKQFAASAIQSMTSSLFRLKAGFPHQCDSSFTSSYWVSSLLCETDNHSKSLSVYYLVTVISVKHQFVLKMQWRRLYENIIRLDGLYSCGGEGVSLHSGEQHIKEDKIQMRCHLCHRVQIKRLYAGYLLKNLYMHKTAHLVKFEVVLNTSL